MKRKNLDTPGRRIAQVIIVEYKLQSVAETRIVQIRFVHHYS